MNIRQIAHALCAACMLFAATMSAQAAEESTPAGMLVYISPQDYEHSIKLWHYFYDYWYEQGPVIEPIAMQALSAEYGDVKMCQGNEIGKSLVWIKPRMYYNPQLEVFYGEVSADIFSANGKALGSYTGESRKHGFLDVYPERQVEAAYKLAMENLMVKIKADPALQEGIKQGVSANEKESPCSMVELLPPWKANDWKHYIKSPGY